MAAQAAKQAIRESGIPLEEIDCIIGACGVMEQAIPSTSVLIQKQLGLTSHGSTTFDINSTCLSFLSALDMASYLIQSKRFKNILICSSDIASFGLNWNHMESCTIFGDGAAAVIVSEATDKNSTRIISSRMETYSEGSSICQLQAGGTKYNPKTVKEDLERLSLFEMDGKSAYKLTASVIDDFIINLFHNTGLSINDIDVVIPHQASQLAIKHLSKRMNLDASKIVNIFPEHGNQIAASMPTAVHEAFKKNLIKSGDKILLLGTGAGISLGGMILEFNQ